MPLDSLELLEPAVSLVSREPVVSLVQREQATCQFYRLIPGAPDPRRADRSADGALRMDAYRYCEPAASAAAFGWYFFPPLNFSLVFDGTEICWTYEGAQDWYPLRVAQYPGFRRAFNGFAPAALHDCAPTFLAQGKLPGTAQIWSGYLARTAPGWALLSRRTVNIPRIQPYDNFEGIFETETWFGPLFTNIQLTRTNSVVEFDKRYPL